MTEELKSKKIAVVGLGVIGASIAGALTQAGAKNVIGMDVLIETLEVASEKHWISEAREIESRSFLDVDWVIVCLYPNETIRFIAEHQQFFLPGTRITDVCGTKINIDQWMKEHLRRDLFHISCHPMAGRESSGIAYADPEFFKGAQFIGIISALQRLEDREALAEMSEAMGFNTIRWMSAEEHDEKIAWFSQMPHVMALLLMTNDTLDQALDMVGSSFKDATRVANINETLWCQLMLDNKVPLIEALDAFERRMKRFRRALKENDGVAICEVMTFAKKKRIGMV